ncbi:MAG: NAD(P)/FAD-dependent oxidoreductase [Phycisphaerales bacterium]|jgi:NADH dehydrogenase
MKPNINSPIVVVIGGGFGGISAVQALAKVPVNVVLIDKANHHLFQPLLYQVATSVLPTSNIAFPIRRIFRQQANAYVFNEEVVSIDCAAHLLTFANNRNAHFDYLIVAAGARSSYFGNDHWERFAPGMKTLDDALTIRNKILRAFEDAEAETNEVALREHLTFIVVGGGPTGVELAGAIKELGVDSLSKDYRRFNSKTARVILIEAGNRLLPSMSESSSHAAFLALSKIGVEIRLNQSVTHIDESGVVVNGETIHANTVVWSAGVKANPLGASLGAKLDRNGRVLVEPDCSINGASNVFVIGDMASIQCAKTGRSVPGVAPAATQMGQFVAKIIAREVKTGSKMTERGAFQYFDKGSMATIGRAQAVAEVAGLKFAGLLAWLAWLFVHLILLVGFNNRILVFMSWAISYLTFSKGSRIISGNPPSRVVVPVGSSTNDSPSQRSKVVAELLKRM